MEVTDDEDSDDVAETDKEDAVVPPGQLLGATGRRVSRFRPGTYESVKIRGIRISANHTVAFCFLFAWFRCLSSCVSLEFGFLSAVSFSLLFPFDSSPSCIPSTNSS